jgi:Cu-processing system permease protein
MPSANRSAAILVARREWKLLRRSRAAGGTAMLLFAVAWLPPLLLAAQAGKLGVASFVEVAPLALAVAGVILPLLALLAGADLLAGEMEDGSLVFVLTLPISRSACYIGKIAGLVSMLGAAYAVAFGSAGLAMVAVHGSVGMVDYFVVVVAGFLLSLSCLGIGAALAAGGRGRVRAYAAALVMWMLLVFAVDAVLLTAVVALAPPAPGQIGQHGHDELAGADNAEDALAAADSPGRDTGTLSAWVMLLDPVDLFRLSALQAGPRLRSQWAMTGLGADGYAPWLRLLVGWLMWAAIPVALGLRRFRRAALA